MFLPLHYVLPFKILNYVDLLTVNVRYKTESDMAKTSTAKNNFYKIRMPFVPISRLIHLEKPKILQ